MWVIGLTEDENVLIKPNSKISKAELKEPEERIFKSCVKDCELMYKLKVDYMFLEKWL